MRLTRRQTLALGAAIGLAAAATAGRGVAAHTLDVIREVYGPEFADQPAAHEFARAYEAFVLEKGLPGRMVHLAYRLGADRIGPVGRRLGRIDESVIDKFATSTNVILAAERGEELVFVALFHPYETSCMNQLGVQALV